MPRNKVSDDLDHIKQDPKPARPVKGRPPDPWPLPSYTPRRIINALIHGQGSLPETMNPDDPFAIFSLFLQ